MFKMSSSAALVAGAFGVLAFASATAQAASGDTSTFAVKANVPAYCIFNGNNTDITLPSYHVNDANPAAVSTTVGLTCNQGTVYSIAFASGNADTDGSFRMTDGSEHYITYTLSTDSAGSDAVTASTGISSVTATGSNDSFTVYAKASPSQNVPVGDYTDTMTATISYSD